MLRICSLNVPVLHEILLVPVLIYGSETMLWKEKERSRIKAVQMDNLRCFLGTRRMDRLPNARISELRGMTKGLKKVFSGGLAMWSEWRVTGFLRESM